jgi:hypothetical protein
MCVNEEKWPQPEGVLNGGVKSTGEEWNRKNI